MESQKLKTLAAIAEIVGAVAVVASLLYVGSEVRRNTAATQAASYQEIVRASNEYLLALATDSALTEIVLRAETDPASLSDSEGRRYFSFSRVFWRNMDNAFVQYRRGVLADSEWLVYRGVACAAKTRDEDWSWQIHENSVSPDFAAIINAC